MLDSTNVIRYLNSYIYRILYINNKKTKNVILISGSGRSGTTWLGDVINWNNDYRIIFEPFDPRKNKSVPTKLLRLYINPNYKDRNVFLFWNEVFYGKFRSLWSDRQNRRFFCSNRLVKEIRSNLHLKWLRENFPKIAIVYIIRDPVDVVYSRIEQGWDVNLEQIINQKELVSLHLRPFISEIQSASSLVSKHAFMWSIENYVSLKEMKVKDITLVEYEKLGQLKYVRNIFSKLGMEDIPNKSILSISSFTRGRGALKNNKEKFRQEYESEITRISSLFNIEALMKKFISND
jgi:hypothetical protein